MVAETKLFFFGQPRLEVDGAPHEFSRRKALALLAYLALYPAEHSREMLAALFWGESKAEAARLSLRVTLGELRKALGEGTLRGERQSLQLAPNVPLWVDVLEFQRVAASLATPADWQKALELYRGDFLPGVDAAWALEWRINLRQLYLETLLRLAAHLRAQAAYRPAIDLARRALALEPANESAHQQIMVCYEALGERPAALNQYETCLTSLAGLRPSTETQAMFQRLQKPGSRSASPAAHATNLPTPLTSFIGREAELDAVESLLVPLNYGEQPARLVTLTGAGGSGKTRLSLQAATDLVDTYPEGVWWVELAELTRPEEVARQVARVCGVHEVPAEAIESSLLAALQTRQLLLVLDNCEHVLAACSSLVHTILDGCSRVQILASSREGLGLPEEQVYPVPTLPLPESNEIDPEAALRFEGVRLFVERARAMMPGFGLAAANLPTVLAICRRLDGIPLAIELAAARLRMLSLEQIAERLDNRFRLLASNDRSALPRQKTLQALIDWSYDLLPAAEQNLLRQLAVFRGGWTLAAAHAVCCEPGQDISRALTQLANKSLILLDIKDQTRYHMLETIREYAWAKLTGAGEAQAASARHLAYYLEYVEQVEPRLGGRGQAASADEVEREHDNLRAAAGWALKHGAPETQYRLGAALGRFWPLYY